MSPPPTPPSLLDRAVEALVAPVRNTRTLVGIAYATGVGGLAVSLVTSGTDGVGLHTLGILSMFVSFTVLFYLSLTLVSVDE